MSYLQYLAYGSNLHCGRLRSRVGEVRTLGMVELPGWRLQFSKRGADGSGKCTLETDPAARAWGVVYAIDATARAKLDTIEGLGHGYTTHWLELPTHGRCYVYLAETIFTDRALRPYDWYRTLVVAGAREHRLPAAYVDAIGAVDALPDPDRARAALNLSVLDPQR